MTPNLGQGANCAMVDALVLMRLLAPALLHGSSLKEVGLFYDRLRRPFVTRIQSAARSRSPPGIIVRSTRASSSRQ